MKTKAAILWEVEHAVERRGDRARPAQAGRGAGQAGRVRPVPLRRAPRHRRPARSRCRSSAATRAPAWWRRSARASAGCSRATTSCSASSRRAAAARAAPPATRTCATWAPRWASACRSPTAPSRHHAKGQDLGLMCLLGTFAHHTVVNEASCIKIDDDVPLDRACLLGCGVVTGWGSAVYAAEVRPGRHRRRRRCRRHRRQRHPGRPARRRQADHRHRPARVQAGEGDGVRRHPHRRLDGGGAAARHRAHLGHDGQQGHHDDGRRRSATCSGRGARPRGQAGPGRRHQHPPGARDVRPTSACSTSR